MALTRVKKWDTGAFHEYLLAHANDPFVWGANDCCLGVANAIESFTGTDIASEFRGLYTDLESAMAAIKEVTGKDGIEAAVEYCAAKHGLVVPHPLCAQRSDLVLMQAANEDGAPLIAGVVRLNGMHCITTGEKGMLRLKITCVKRAWKI